MLLTIREVLATDTHLTNEQRVGVIGGIAEGDGSGLASLHRHVLRLFEDDGISLRIDEFQQGLAREVLLRDIEDTGRDRALITIAQESGHVGLDHHILLCHSLTRDAAITHILGMNQTHEPPRGETLR